MSDIDLDKFPISATAQRMLHRVSPIYSNAYVVKWLYEVMGRELDDAWKIVHEMPEQAFTQTVTWGIEAQEYKYSIKPDDSLSIEERRARLYRKRASGAAISPGWLENYIQNSWGILADIDETYAEGAFSVYIHQDVRHNLPKMIKDLRVIKPSHLAIGLITVDLHPDKDIDIIRHFYGLADCHLGRKRIRIPPPDDASIEARSGVCYFRSGRMRIGAGEEPPPSVLAQRVGVLAYRVGRVRIPYNPDDRGQAHESRLYPAGAGHHIGTASLLYGRRHIGLTAPERAGAQASVGIASATIGRKRIRSAAPPESMTEPRGGRIILRTGRITIQTLKEET